MSNYKERINAALGVALRRQDAHPLDVSTVFLCIEDLQAYVRRDVAYSNPAYDEEDNLFLRKINPYSYPGQIVAVLDELKNKANAYIIQKCGPEGTYKEFSIGQNELYFGSKISFPEVGEDNILYLATDENKLYYWTNGKYQGIENPNETITSINGGDASFGLEI